MNDLPIREATGEDVPAILSLYREAGIDDENNFTVAEASSHLAALKQYPSFRVFVACADQVVVGTYELLIMDNMAKRGRRAGIVEDVAVHPQYQGRGVGRAMMQHALEQCRQADCYKLSLSSNLKREDAHRFYDSLGFKRHGYSFQIDLP
jgi:ribosomal protein S18 acetylase RimI-like enzyme